MNSALTSALGGNVRLPPDVNRVLYVKSLPQKITTEDMYDIFGKYGSIRQIRLGNSNQTRGTAYVVYDDIFEAKTACENLNGLHVGGMYLIECRCFTINRAEWESVKKGGTGGGVRVHVPFLSTRASYGEIVWTSNVLAQL